MSGVQYWDIIVETSASIMYVLIGALNVIAILCFIFFWHNRLINSSIKPYFLPALVLKLLAGIALGLIYKYYYEVGDTIVYFKDAITLTKVAYSSPLDYLRIILGASVGNLHYADQPRALFFVKILSLPAIITFGNYWLSGIYFSLFSFLGIWKLTNSFSRLSPNTKIYAVVAFLFYPSFVFWTSGVLKEPVAIGCLLLCLAIYLPFIVQNENIKWMDVLLSFFLLVVIWQLKFYYAVVFIPVLTVGVVNAYLRASNEFIRNSVPLQCILSMLLLVMLYFPIAYLQPLINVQNILIAIVRNHDWYFLAGIIPAEGYIQFFELKPALGSFIENLPLALFSGLFRPVIFDANNTFQYLVAIENSLLLMFFVASFFNINNIRKSTNVYFIILLLFYIVTLACVLAFAAPNFGSLMRYKVAFLPFLLYLVLAKNPIITYFQNRVK